MGEQVLHRLGVVGVQLDVIGHPGPPWCRRSAGVPDYDSTDGVREGPFVPSDPDTGQVRVPTWRPWTRPPPTRNGSSSSGPRCTPAIGTPSPRSSPRTANTPTSPRPPTTSPGART